MPAATSYVTFQGSVEDSPGTGPETSLTVTPNRPYKTFESNRRYEHHQQRAVRTTRLEQPRPPLTLIYDSCSEIFGCRMDMDSHLRHRQQRGKR